MLIFNADGTATMANEDDIVLEDDDADGEFIGLNGTYYYMNADGDVISSIEISQDAYTFLEGNGFHLVNMQPALYFVSEDEIRYVPGGEQSDKYYKYEIFLKTENYHGEEVWQECIRIGPDAYRMYFSDDILSLEGIGSFAGVYEKI